MLSIDRNFVKSDVEVLLNPHCSNSIVFTTEMLNWQSFD